MVGTPVSRLPDEHSGLTFRSISSWLARSEWKLTIAVVAAWGVGKAGLNTMPILFSALTAGLGFDSEQLGKLGSIELLAVALGSISMAPFAARVPRHWLAIALGLCSVVGYLLSAAASGYATLAGIRFAMGLACGSVVALGNASGATSKNPDALFGWLLILASVAAFLLLWVLPYAIGAGGYAGGYLMVGGVSLATIPFLYWLPETHGSRIAESHASTLAAASAQRLSKNTLAALAILAANFIQGFTSMALWAFTATLGERAGYSLVQLGLVIGIGTAVLTAGALVPILIGSRWGRSLPVFVTTTVMGISQWGLVHAASPGSYTAMIMLWCAAAGALFPYLISATAALDRLGRWTAAAGSMALFGGAFGPAVAGITLNRFGYDALGWLLLACAVAGLAFSIPATRWIDRGSDAQPFHI